MDFVGPGWTAAPKKIMTLRIAEKKALNFHEKVPVFGECPSVILCKQFRVKNFGSSILS